MNPIDRVIEWLQMEANECPETWMADGLAEIESLQADLVKKDQEIIDLNIHIKWLDKIAEELGSKWFAEHTDLLIANEQISAKDAEIASWIEDRDIWIKRYEAARADGEKEIASQKAYIQKLETAIVEEKTSLFSGLCDDPEQEAKDALEKIRNG